METTALLFMLVCSLVLMTLFVIAAIRRRRGIVLSTSYKIVVYVVTAITVASAIFVLVS